MTGRTLLSLAALAGMATAANAQVVALATFGDTLFRVQTDGTFEQFTLSDRIIGATATASGDIIMSSSFDQGGSVFGMYRLDDAFGPAPSLTGLGTTSGQRASGMTEIGGTLYSLTAGDLYTMDGAYNQTLVGNMGLVGDAASTGSAAYDADSDTFYMVTRDDNLYTVDYSNVGNPAATLVGNTGTDVFNAGAEFHGGDLYLASFNDQTSILSIGTVNTGNGSFSSFADIDVSSLLGAGPIPSVSLVVVPTPSGLAVLGLGGLLAARRRR